VTPDVRNAARGALAALPDDSAAAFSNLVERVRQYRGEMVGKP